MAATILSKFRALDIDDEKQLKSCFDDIINQAPADDHEYLREIVNALIQMNFKCVNAMDHPFFVRIRNTFVNDLEKSVDNFDLSCRISQLFSQLTDYIDDKNFQLVWQLFADSNLTECLIASFKNLSSTSNSNLLNSIEHMIDAYQKFQENRPTVQNDPILSTLAMPIVDFIKSVEYQNSFFQLSTKQDELTNFQQLILITCPRYITSHFW